MHAIQLKIKSYFQFGQIVKSTFLKVFCFYRMKTFNNFCGQKKSS